MAWDKPPITLEQAADVAAKMDATVAAYSSPFAPTLYEITSNDGWLLSRSSWSLEDMFNRIVIGAP